VVVRVDEAGEDRAASCVDLLRPLFDRIPDVTIVPDAGDQPIADGDRLGLRARRVDRPDLRVPDQQVHRSGS
jgi:hypothetical protein